MNTEHLTYNLKCLFRAFLKYPTLWLLILGMKTRDTVTSDYEDAIRKVKELMQ